MAGTGNALPLRCFCCRGVGGLLPNLAAFIGAFGGFFWQTFPRTVSVSGNDKTDVLS